MTDRTTTANEGFAAVSRPNPVEADAPVTRIEGEIPRELAGTLYRNGPNQHIAPEAGVRALHFFDGDALVQAIRFEDGQAHHLGRYAQTESYLRNAAENAYVVGGLSVKPDRVVEPPVPGHSPNTNIVPHGGRLFAMAENMPPFEMDPETLESRGLWDYDGKMLGVSTTAHPKIDGKTGQMWIHGYQPVGKCLNGRRDSATGSGLDARYQPAPGQPPVIEGWPRGSSGARPETGFRGD